MHVLIYDTETSGLPLFKEPSEDPRQPHICEIAGLLFDSETRKLVEHVHYLVRQEGWDVEPEAFKAHGITKERSFDEGIDEAKAFNEFYRLHDRCDLRVAHNESFDQRIARIAIKRFGDGKHDEMSAQEDRDIIADAFKAKPAYCTMKSSTPILNLPATKAMIKYGRGSWKKSPSLAEAYRYFFHEDFEGAHSALADAWACARCYFKLTQDFDIGKQPCAT